MALITVCNENLRRLPALVKIGQIVLLLIIVCIAQIGPSYPGFGGAATRNTTKPNETLHYVESKNVYFFGSGICTYYFVNCAILVLCYWMGDTTTQTSKYELAVSVLGSIFFLSLAMKTFVTSSSNNSSEDRAKLITEGCCCIGVAVLQIFDAIFVHRRIQKGGDGW